MRTRGLLALAACALVFGAPSLEAASAHRATSSGDTPQRPAVAPISVARLPLHFEPNLGQASETVAVIARTPRYAVALAADAVTLAPPRGAARVRMRFVGSTAAATIAPQEALPGKTHYLRGNEPAKWVRHVPQFARTVAHDVYPGIDVHYRDAPGRRLRYDLHVAPGADPAEVRLRFEGAESLAVQADGTLVVRTVDGEFRHSAPHVFQEIAGARHPVPGRFQVREDRTVGFALGSHDPRRALVIDPTIEYASYVGGTAFDQTRGIDIDATGAAFVCGDTELTDLFTVSPLQPANAGGIDSFVAKINPAGDAHVFLTYFGGSDEEQARGIEVDSAGAAYVGGRSESSDFPTVNSVQPSRGGNEDAYVAKLAPSDGASLVYSTYLGGDESDEARAIALGSDNSVFATGFTRSQNFPTQNPIQPNHGGGNQDPWVAKISPDGQMLLFSTYLGGDSGDEDERGNGLGVTSDDCVVVGGETSSPDFPLEKPFQGSLRSGDQRSGFITKLSPAGDSLVFSTYVGGSDRTIVEDVCVGPDDTVYATGNTRSDDFPVAFPLQSKSPVGGDAEDAIVMRMSADGRTLLYSTFLGGDDHELGNGITADATGAAYVAGNTFSRDFPIRDAVIETYAGQGDGFVTKITPSGSAIVYSTYLDVAADDDGSASAVAVDANGAAYVVADVDSDGFPVHAQAVQPNYRFNHDGLYVKLAPQAGNVPPPQTIRSFLLPKKLQVTVGPGKGAPGVSSKGFFDTGPGDVDFTAAATFTLGPREIAMPGLEPIKNGKAFQHSADGFTLTITPAKTGSSKAKYKLSLDADLAGEVNLNGPFTMRYAGGGIDAEGTVVLGGGRFTFGRVPGTLVAPEIDIRKAKAKLPGVGRHAFKFVAGLAGDGNPPGEPPTTRVAFGDIFAVDLASDSLKQKKDAFVLGGPVGRGVKAVNLDFAKERISVRGGDVDLGDVADGPISLLLIVTIDDEERAVQVRAVRKGKSLKY